jgi:adenylate cyclase
MNRARSVPFSITLITLMALIVLPLSAALMWLGWRAVNQLEERSIRQSMASLESAVEGFLTSGLRLITAVGATLAEAPSFAADAGRAADAERFRQLVAAIERRPAVAAVYVGYPDGRFLYVGRTEMMSVSQRLEYDVPDAPSLILRMVEGEGAARRDVWRFEMPDGSRTAESSRPLDYDPRTRPWYAEAANRKAAVLTEPYRFAQTNLPGVSAGVPLRGGGVIGFDFTLDTLSRLIGDFKLTPNAVIMIASENGTVFMESEACKLADVQCLPGENEVRVAMRTAIAQFGSGGRRIEHDLVVDGREYRLLVHDLPPIMGQRYVIAATVPMVELAAESRALMRRAALAAVIAVALAAVAALVAALLLARSIAHIAGKTERIRNLDFSDRTPVRSRITEIARLGDAIERMRSGLEVFGRYVSKNLVQQIMRSPDTAGVGGVRRDITVMFTDIEGFSRPTAAPSTSISATASWPSGTRPSGTRTISPMPAARPCRPASPVMSCRSSGRSAAGRAFAPASACIPGRRWWAMSARAIASTTPWSAPSPTRPRGWRA